MTTYIIKRLGLALLVALFVSLVSFLMLRVAGDPAIAMAGEGASAADIEYIRKQFGLDRPLLVQYVGWLADILSGNLGESTYFSVPVSDLLAKRSWSARCSHPAG